MASLGLINWKWTLTRKDSPVMNQEPLVKRPAQGPQATVAPQVKPAAVPLDETLAAIRCDAQTAAHEYLKDTQVPHGGE